MDSDDDFVDVVAGDDPKEHFREDEPEATSWQINTTNTTLTNKGPKLSNYAEMMALLRKGKKTSISQMKINDIP